VLGIGYLIPMIYFIASLRSGPKAGDNPWDASGLEWQIQSPPTTFNFDQTPTVTEEAYNYGPLEEVIG
jgi:cytochrome c oxidase subunit I